MSPLVCVVIRGPGIGDIERQVMHANTLADCLEWRLDLFDELSLEQLAPLRRLCKLPIIFTLRAARQGGGFKGTESARLHLLESLLVLNPTYIDVEYDVTGDFIDKIKKEYPQLQVIISSHYLVDTPEDLKGAVDELQRLSGDLYKIATVAKTTTDALRLLTVNSTKELIKVAMGEVGQFSRVAGPLFYSPISYAALKEDLRTAPGQILVEDLLTTYQYRNLSEKTRLFGLIGGHNVEKSFGHLTHNAVMQQLGFDSVYVKMLVEDDEIEDFLELARDRFSGLSVTMPLKEAMIPFLDGVDLKAMRIGAVNTIVFENGRAIGHNTDCMGALNVIEEKVKVKGNRLVLLGAGGAARAIAYEAHLRGADVLILNRDVYRAKELAEEFNCLGGSLEEFGKVCKDGYDILVNATSSPSPIDVSMILPDKVVLDVNTRPLITDFLKGALSKKCEVISGYQMFAEQAGYQFKLWFGDDIDVNHVKEIIKKRVIE